MKNYHSIIKKARKYLNANRIIAIPTETVYGLAGNAYSNKSVEKIHRQTMSFNYIYLTIITGV